jgi:hypothetical protein
MGELARGRVPFKVKGCLIDKHASAFQTKIARGLAETQIGPVSLAAPCSPLTRTVTERRRTDSLAADGQPEVRSGHRQVYYSAEV